MNGPKVREVIKTEIVSEKTARKLISKFLEREGEEEIKTNEALTRLSFMAQVMDKNPLGVKIENEASFRTPTLVEEATVGNSKERKQKEKARKRAEKILKKQEKKAKKAEEKAAKKQAKQEKKEAKKQAKRERKEKRKKEKESPMENSRMKKKQKTM
mmetsp:Transcript_27405/g.41489  ORF Transcript_27405/g.41489 Transcript_27405/m.41489 type:complete len:157 (-) Transcript_27405:265-735(-)